MPRPRFSPVKGRDEESVFSRDWLAEIRRKKPILCFLTGRVSFFNGHATSKSNRSIEERYSEADYNYYQDYYKHQ